jgi:hypothetical protein
VWPWLIYGKIRGNPGMLEGQNKKLGLHGKEIKFG